MAEEISETADHKGFWDTDLDDFGMIPLKLALIHSEVTEALDVFRREYDDDDTSSYSGMTPMQEDDFVEEVADVIIRCLDLIGFYGLDNLGEVIISKMEKNATRPHRHGKRF